MEISQERIERFWDWCGAKPVGTGELAVLHEMPDGSHLVIAGTSSIDLNNLFKYAVPKVFKLSYDIRIQNCLEGWLVLINNSRQEFETRDKNLNTALFLAIEKLIGG